MPSRINTQQIQALLFDFGGTIDTGGLHWLHVLYPLWDERLPGLDPDLYRRAFAHGERTLATEKIILPTDNFLDLLEKKLAIQAAFLKDHHIACTIRDQKAIADEAYQEAEDSCQRHSVVIKRLKHTYRIAMVSNFYGNLRVVLEDFRIAELFESVIESATVGVKKPDPRIWQLGCDRLNLLPAQCLAIGDSFAKDMRPATTIGCQGLWLQGKGWEDDPVQDRNKGTKTELPSGIEEAAQSLPIQPIHSLEEMTTLLQK